jgi:hypothetical protein
MEKESTDANQEKIVKNHQKIASLYAISLSGAGNRVETTLSPVAEIMRRTSLGVSDANDQNQLMSLQALQNARLIEQNDKIIALLQTIAAKK